MSLPIDVSRTGSVTPSTPTPSSAIDREPDDLPLSPETGHRKRRKRTNAATGASAAGVRALSAQAVAFYFKAPAKAFFPARME